MVISKHLEDSGNCNIDSGFTGWKRYSNDDLDVSAASLERDTAGTRWFYGSNIINLLKRDEFRVFFSEGKPCILLDIRNGCLVNGPTGVSEFWGFRELDGEGLKAADELIAFDYIRRSGDIVADPRYLSDMARLERLFSSEATWKDAFLFGGRQYPLMVDRNVCTEWDSETGSRISMLLSSCAEERMAEGVFHVSELPREIIKLSDDGETVTVVGDIPEHVKGIYGEFMVSGEVSAPGLRHLDCALQVQNGAAFNCPRLESVAGVVELLANSSFHAPVISSINGYLFVGEQYDFASGIKLDAPELRLVSHSLCIAEDVELSLPRLEYVGMGLDVFHDSKLVAPSLKSVDCFHAENVGSGAGCEAVLIAPRLEFMHDNFENVDGRGVVEAPVCFKDNQLVPSDSGITYITKDNVVQLVKEGKLDTPVRKSDSGAILLDIDGKSCPVGDNGFFMVKKGKEKQLQSSALYRSICDCVGKAAVKVVVSNGPKRNRGVVLS